MVLSVIIPAYNEEKRISSTLQKIGSFFDGKNMDYEVIVVDDGSGDRTVEISDNSALAKSGRLKVFRNGENRGKGYSVKRGVDVADGEYILFSDADLSTPVSAFDKLFESIGNGADVAIGSRAAAGSVVTVKQPFYRQTMGRVFNLLIRCILGERVWDTQCGFKLFRKEAAKTLFGKMTVTGFAFDAEILFLARRLGFKTEEVGISWENSPDSKVHPLFSSLRMLTDVIKIRLAHR